MEYNPLPQQVLGTNWLAQRKHAALFADMGLGKSAATLDALHWNYLDGGFRGALIVAPLRVANLTWPNEIEQWDKFHWMKVSNLRKPEGKKAWLRGEPNIYTINYEMLPRFSEELLAGSRSLPVSHIVYDELSVAKNPSSKRINKFRSYRALFENHWGLTGTPRPNGLYDIYAQVRLLDGGERFGAASSVFLKAHFEPEDRYSEYSRLVPRPGAEATINRKLADLALVLRREDWMEIPPTFVEDIDVQMPPEAKAKYKELQREMLAELIGPDGNPVSVIAVNAAAKVRKLLQITSGAAYDGERTVGFCHNAKIEALVKLNKAIKEPLLVAADFQHEQQRILRAIPEAEPFREDSLARWNAGKIKMLVSHPKSIGHGLNLQKGGCKVVWFTLSYSRELYDQFNARVARTGQNQITTIYRLICPGTIDDAVAETLRQKGEEQNFTLMTIRNLQRVSDSV